MYNVNAVRSNPAKKAWGVWIRTPVSSSLLSVNNSVLLNLSKTMSNSASMAPRSQLSFGQL